MIPPNESTVWLGARPAFDPYFIIIADAISLRGTCKRLRVGAVLVSLDNRIISTGYNGQPRGLPHCTDVGCIMDDSGKHCTSIHAEHNAMLNASSGHGNVKGASMYTTAEPCLRCARMMINCGIKRAVYMFNYGDNHDGVEFLTRNGVAVLRVMPKELVDVKV